MQDLQASDERLDESAGLSDESAGLSDESAGLSDESVKDEASLGFRYWLRDPGVVVPTLWLGAIVFIWATNWSTGLEAILDSPSLFVLTALLATIGMFFTEHPLSSHPRRTVGGKAGRKARQIWVTVTVLPFLTVVALAPVWLEPGPEPLLHVLSRWFAGLSAAYLGYVSLRRAASVVGVTLPKKYRSQGVDMPAAGQIRWRPLQTAQLLSLAVSIRHRLEAAGHEVLVELEASGDRDVHVRLDAGELVVVVLHGVIMLSGRRGLNAATANVLRSSRGMEGAAVVPGPSGWEVHYEKRADALRSIDRFLELRDTRGGDRGTLHDAVAGSLTFYCLARTSQGRAVSWTSDGSQLVVEEEGAAEKRFDLQRSFRLLVSRSPAGSQPMLQVLLRQSDGESGAAARWQEARLAVSLREHDEELDDFPEEVMDAPVVLDPEGFGEVWSGLYWCADAVGGRPPRLPALETGVGFVAAEQLSVEPLSEQRTPGCLSGLANGFNVLLVFSFLIVLGSSAAVWPILEQTWRGWWVMLTLAAILLLMRHRVLWWGRRSMESYLAAAEEELKRLLDGFVGHVVPVAVFRTEDLPSTGEFFSSGIPVDLQCDTEEGISLILQMWPAGLRAHGAAVAERLEISGERGSGFAERLQQVIRVLERNQVAHSTRDDGSRLTLVMETRRILGGGASAWHSLIGLVCDTLTPERVPSHIPRSLPDTLPSSPRLTSRGLAHVVGKPWRGAKSALATVGLAAVALGFPVIHPEVYPLPADTQLKGNWGDQVSVYGPTVVPDGALAAQCPEGETLYASLVELRCLINAADGVLDLGFGSRLDVESRLRPYRFRSPVVMREGELRHVPQDALSCPELETWLGELASDRWHSYVDVLGRRLSPPPPWAEYAYPLSQHRWDKSQIGRRAKECGVSEQTTARAFELEAKYERLFRSVLEQ